MTEATEPEVKNGKGRHPASAAESGRGTWRCFITFMCWTWLNQLLTLLWVFGVTNAFNLLDNMDGLSAGVAAVAKSGSESE